MVNEPAYGALPPPGHQIGDRIDQLAINAAVNSLNGKVSKEDVATIVDAYVDTLKMMYIFSGKKVSEL